jgi:hypothetical protein
MRRGCIGGAVGIDLEIDGVTIGIFFKLFNNLLANYKDLVNPDNGNCLPCSACSAPVSGLFPFSSVFSPLFSPFVFYLLF